MPVDGSVRCASVVIHCGLHFDKDQRISIPGNDVDFAMAAAGAKISIDNDKLSLLQKTHREVFTANAVCALRSPASTTELVAQAVKQARNQTPSPCRARQSTGSAPRSAGSAETGSPSFESPAIARMLVALRGRKSHACALWNSSRSRRGFRRSSGKNSC